MGNLPVLKFSEQGEKPATNVIHISRVPHWLEVRVRTSAPSLLLAVLSDNPRILEHIRIRRQFLISLWRVKAHICIKVNLQIMAHFG